MRGTKNADIVEELLSHNEIKTSVLTLAELSDRFSRENIDFANAFDFIIKKSEILGVSKNAALESGKFKNKQKRMKKRFSLADAIVYLTAKENNCIFVTIDKDFENLKNVFLLEA